MPKRKRSAYEDSGDRVRSSRKNDVSATLLQSKKLLHRALKTAKGFERQKLGKRLKNATKSGSKDEVTRINREIEALKGLDLGKMTEAQLYKSLLKVKAVAASKLLPEEVRRELLKPEGTEEERKALHNVTSGMWNTKPVKEFMEGVMGGMCAALGIPAPVVKGKGRVQEEPVKGNLNNGVVSMSRRVEKEDAKEAEEESGSEAEDSYWDGLESEDVGEDLDADGGVKIVGNDEERDDELDEEQISRYDALLGASSDEESFDESKYDLKRSSHPSARLSLSLSPSPSRSPSPLLSDAQNSSPSPPPERAPKLAKAKIPKPAPPKPGGSTFLPTLMGGYWSGSESSASDLEDSLRATPRKNRPGQTARRAIWEKKFGKGANHIKSGKGAVAEKRGKGRDDGWDPKRGATESGGDRNRGRGWERGRGRERNGPGVTGGNAVAVEPRKRATKRDDTGPLHPSWEAAKRAKEEKKSATFQGKKVSFD